MSHDSDMHDADDQLRRAADQITMREEYSRAIFLAAVDGMVSVNASGAIESANPAALALLGYSEEELADRAVTDVLDLGADGFARVLDRPQVQTALAAAAGRGFEITARRKDGTTFPASVTVGKATVWRATRYILVIRDLTREKEASAALERMAFIDPLTDLGNRYWIRHQFEELARDGDREVCLVLVNLDWFRRINDSLGHRVGDEAIVAVAERIRSAEGPSASADRYYAGRMGGDEFAVLIAGDGEPRDWQAIADALRERISQPFELSGIRVTLVASVGYAHARLATADFDRLVNEADIAMRRAKAEGNYAAQGYQRSMGLRASGAVVLEEGIRLGLARGELVAYFQPKIDIGTGEIRGAEALVRWAHPEAGLLLPHEFLPTAEASELVGLIGEAVLADVLRLQARAMAAGLARPVAINLSARQFGSPSLAASVARSVADAGIPASLISFEVTEGVVAAEEDRHLVLQTLRDAGFSIAVDDFGVAQSSLSRLRSIPMDELKIDKSFVDNVPASTVDANILRAMVSLGTATGAHVVIEGVERGEQLDFLRGLPSCCAQGFLFARAVSADEYLAMLRQQPWRRDPEI